MKTYVITGGNSGLGYETALRVAGGDSRVILGCRSQEKGKTAAEAITLASGNPHVEARVLDLASMRSAGSLPNL